MPMPQGRLLSGCLPSGDDLVVAYDATSARRDDRKLPAVGDSKWPKEARLRTARVLSNRAKPTSRRRRSHSFRSGSGREWAAARHLSTRWLAFPRYRRRSAVRICRWQRRSGGPEGMETSTIDSRTRAAQSQEACRVPGPSRGRSTSSRPSSLPGAVAFRRRPRRPARTPQTVRSRAASRSGRCLQTPGPLATRVASRHRIPSRRAAISSRTGTRRGVASRHQPRSVRARTSRQCCS